MFADTNPPLAAQISAACGLARYFSSSCAPLVFFIATASSPPPSTELGRLGLIDGNGKKFASVPTFSLVFEAMTPATKSPS